MKKLLGSTAASVALAGVLAAAAPAAHAAALVYVGSWEVDQGPSWSTNPLAYTGQEAAALLFGGSAANYAISTVGTNPALVNDEAWYSILGYPNGTQFAENYVSCCSDQAPGHYYSGGGFAYDDVNEAASAYVDDNAQGPSYTNYAFLVSAPEPASMALLGVGLAGLGLIRRRRA